ncbi:MAG: metal ABC transporter permease [Myxococcota bacterium]
MNELLTEPFFQRVLLAGLLASVACGVLGTWVVAKRMTSMAGGLAHAAFGGVGLGYWAGIAPMLGAAGFGVAAGLLIGLAYRRLHTALDTLISTVWAAGMAVGILFIALTPGYAPNLLGYLFGSLLFVSWDFVLVVALLDLLIVGVVAWLFRDLQAVAFDEEFAEVVGVPVERLLLLLLALTSLGIVVLIRVVGVILVIALLTVPAATARHWSDDLRRMMLLAVGISAGCTVGGLLLSAVASDPRGWSLPPGPLIVLLAVSCYGVSAGARRLATRRLLTAG